MIANRSTTPATMKRMEEASLKKPVKNEGFLTIVEKDFIPSGLNYELDSLAAFTHDLLLRRFSRRS